MKIIVKSKQNSHISQPQTAVIPYPKITILALNFLHLFKATDVFSLSHLLNLFPCQFAPDIGNRYQYYQKIQSVSRDFCGFQIVATGLIALRCKVRTSNCGMQCHATSPLQGTS